MMTRRYLLSTTSSRSSMGGLVMPSAAVIPATVYLPLWPVQAVVRALSGRHQEYQLLTHVLDGRVHQRNVELAAGFDLLPRRVQPARDDRGRLRAAAGEPAHQLLSGRRRE